MKLLRLPLELKAFYVSMQWHQSSQDLPEQIWLRSHLEQVALSIAVK